MMVSAAVLTLPVAQTAGEMQERKALPGVETAVTKILCTHPYPKPSAKSEKGIGPKPHWKHRSKANPAWKATFLSLSQATTRPPRVCLIITRYGAVPPKLCTYCASLVAAQSIPLA